MTVRRKVLFVSLDVPSRTGSGAVVRTFHFLRKLSLENDVDLLTLQPVDDTNRRLLERMCKRVISPQAGVTAEISIWLQITWCLLFPFADFLLPLNECLLRVRWSLEHGKNRLLTKIILQIAKWSLGTLKIVGVRLGFGAPAICSLYYHSLGKCTPSIIASPGPDPARYGMLWFEHTVSFPLIKILEKSVFADYIVCNSHNVEHLLAMQLAKNIANGEAEVGVTARTETRCLRSVDVTLACSQADKRELQKLCPQADVFVAPNGVELSYFDSGINRCHDGFTLLFTGTMSYQPNLEGVNYFIKEIYPLIKAQEPRTKLIVAGREADLIRLSAADIEVVANPVDMRVQFCRATIAIVPLKNGSGTRLKILEAMAMGLPVVSTSIGAEGVDYSNGQDLLIADSPEQFSKAVIDLMRDPSEQKRLSAAGRCFVEKSSDWEAITSYSWEQIEQRCPKVRTH